MPAVDPVIIELIVKNSAAEAALRSTTRIADQQLKMQERRVVSLERQFARSGAAIAGTLRTLVGGFAGLAAAREFLRLVDASKQIEAQLRLATRESGSFARAQEDVRRIAMSTRSGLEETAKLYSVFTRDAQALGISQTEAARATETLTKSFLISGASAEETAGATRQLIQGLQSGTLRGDEFNSVMEQAPRLQKLFAGALGVSKGELRAMAEEGRITAAALIDALTNRKFTEGIDAEFRELPVTFEQAMQQVSNAAIITFGAFDRGGGFSQALSNFVTDGANGFADLEDAAVETGIDIRSTFEGLAGAFDPLLDRARQVFSLIESDAKTLADRVRPIFGEIDAITGFLGRLDKGIEDSPTIFGPINKVINSAVFGGTGGTNLLGSFNENQARSERQLRGTLAEQWLADMYRGVDVMGNRITPSMPTRGGGASAARGGGRRGPSAETLAARAERERLNAIREEGQKQQELLGLQDDILAARAALATAADDVARFETQQLAIEQASRLSQLNTEKRLGELTQEEYDARAAAIAEETALRRQAIDRRRDENEADAQREALRQQSDQLALEADALYARADIADTLEQRRQLEARALEIQQQIERDLLEQAIAEGKIADAAAARAALADRQASDRTALGKRNQGALDRYLDDTTDPRAAAEEAAVRELQSVRDGLAEGLADQLGTKNQFVKDLLSIFLDEVIFRPLAESMRNAKSGEGIASLINAGLTALGLPGFASGGSMMIGGRSGTDNNTLSLNGVPMARVSRGERLDIVPNGRLSSRPAQIVQPIINVDARGSVMNDQFARMILDEANRTAAGIAASMGKTVLKAVPSRLEQFQSDGT